LPHLQQGRTGRRHQSGGAMRGAASLRSLSGSTSLTGVGAALSPRRTSPALSPGGAVRGPGRSQSDGFAGARNKGGGRVLDDGRGTLADRITAWSQHRHAGAGGWVRSGSAAVAGGAPGWESRAGLRAMSQRGDSAACVRGRGEDDAAEDEPSPGRGSGDLVLSGADWYALEGYRRSVGYAENGRSLSSPLDARASKQRAAMTMMVMLLDALATKKTDDAAVIINSVKIHSRLPDVPGKTVSRRFNLPQGVADGADGANGANVGARGDAHSGDGSNHGARVDSHGHSMLVNGHANGSVSNPSHLSNGALNGSPLDGPMHAPHQAPKHVRGVNGPEDAAELERLFEAALIVHRGKPGLEAARPNPYTGDKLPEDLAMHVPVRDCIWSRPVDEDKLPAFFSQLLQQWEAASVFQQTPSAVGEGESAASAPAPIGASRPGRTTTWVKASRDHGQMVREQVMEHPEWGKAAMVRQLYSEQVCH